MAASWRGRGTGCSAADTSRPYDVFYIVIDPGMPGNRDRDTWRVVEEKAWLAYVDRGRVPPVSAVFRTAQEAAERRDRLNGPLYPPTPGPVDQEAAEPVSEPATLSDGVAVAEMRAHLRAHPSHLTLRHARPDDIRQGVGTYGPLPPHLPEEQP